MTVHQETITSRTGGFAGDCPAPVSLETFAVVEQVLLRMLGELRERMTPAAPDAAGIEYESWLRGARH